MLFIKENSTVREKRFDPRILSYRKTHHTMTDDYSLFFLHRNREKMEKGEAIPHLSWWFRIFR